MLSYWRWKQQAKNTSTLISLEGTKRGKGQWSIRITSVSTWASYSRALICSYWICRLLLEAEHIWWHVSLTDMSSSMHCYLVTCHKSFPSTWAASLPLFSPERLVSASRKLNEYSIMHFKQCNLLLPWEIRAQPQAVSWLQKTSLSDCRKQLLGLNRFFHSKIKIFQHNVFYSVLLIYEITIN